MNPNPIEDLLQQIKNQSLWSKEIVINRNEFLTVSGSIDSNLYYIIKGSLRVFFEDKEDEHTIRLGYQGDFIASLDTFFLNKPTEFHIQAIKKCTLKIISKEKFLALVHQNEKNLNLWNMLLSQLVLQQIEREKDLLTSSPLERYKRVLARSPNLFQEIPSKYIASYLRMTPETLSRIKKS